MRYFLISLLLLIWNITAIADELPDLGEYSETVLSTKTEQRLAKEFIQEVRQTVPILDDPVINNYIQTLGNKLTAHAHTKRKKFYFFVISDPSIKAFAGPGGYIGINSGTITTVNSESKLAAIMAHEIAHVTQHHLERLIASTKNTQMVATAGIPASILIGTTTNNKSISNAANSAALTSMAGATQHIINFTRKHEIEADNINLVSFWL
ncbi:MAG: M48 family metalloprotease [Coxiellaceae bacterium]|jgi:predicted Zn-dependent protease|nr:M48 family metalloprotease [Coxiellaceae bacterium]